jgi:pyridoxamine 5'-phosphate oxidase
MNIGDMRKEYAVSSLTEADAGDDPFLLFGMWFHAAISAKLPEPNAMTLATATSSGVPSARIVLLKLFDHSGFCFATNYTSRKGQELAANPRCALVFHWHELERQVRIEGTAERTTVAESDHYFASRPRSSRLGAIASPQSQVIANRTVLDRRFIELEDQFPGEDIPRPDFWGGFRVAPSVIEFWQGRPSRLHDRLRFTKQSNGTWLRERLGS